jgi:hypothetical protein
MKSIIILLLLIGVATVVYGYMKSFYKPEPPKTEVKYIERSLFNQQMETKVSEQYKDMFEEKTASLI